MVRLTALLTLAIAFAAPCLAEALPHRSWQFQEPNWNTLATDIPRAASAGMNRIQLSHHIVMDAEELWEKPGHEERLALVRRAVALAHEHGLAVDMWTHELSGVPSRFREGRRVKLSPELWQWLDEKYEKLFTLVPELDALVLTFAETDYSIYKDGSVVSDLPPVERFVKMIDVLSAASARHDKQIIVRTFVYEPNEIEWIGEALTAVAKRSGARHNITVMTKCVPHDWQPHYPYNPLLGNVGGLPQIVEMDLGQEFTGKSRLLHCEVDYVSHVLAHARQKGVVGAVARVERYEYRALDTPGEVNLHAFSRLLSDASPTSEELWREWAVARYGEAAAPHVIAALRRTYDTTNLTLFPLGQWVANHTRVPDWNYAVDHLRRRSTGLWIASPEDELVQQELLRPSWSAFDKVSSEKDLARRLLERSRRDLLAAQPHLSAADYKTLVDYLDFAEDNVEVFRHHNLALLAALSAQQSNHRADYVREARKHVAALRDCADRMEERYGKDALPGNPARIRAFADEVEKELEKRP